ncbi:PH domain-containing protein [Nigerium massiliense]|uniref:PH domain-containing protein n=1 Tax=Nigerium massiliense TaxID=1522317 RepID=UPI00058D435F|nr:PH domain-containing protein [Nigerium massiliense]
MALDLSRLLWPQTSRRMLVSEGEFIVDEVMRHWVTLIVPVLLVIAGMVVFACMPLLGPLWWLGLVAGLGLGGYGFYRMHYEYMDRFVITNMRVFRVHGIFNQHLATVPIARILDISVLQPPLGLLLGYGHFVFESAAQDQGLKRIEFVPNIDERDLTIQRVIQRAGLRARMDWPDADEDDGAS